MTRDSTLGSGMNVVSVHSDTCPNFTVTISLKNQQNDTAVKEAYASLRT